MIFTIKVGWTADRPIIPDQYTAYVRVAADTDTDARLTACLMVDGWKWCEMVTSATVIDAEI